MVCTVTTARSFLAAFQPRRANRGLTKLGGPCLRPPIRNGGAKVHRSWRVPSLHAVARIHAILYSTAVNASFNYGSPDWCSVANEDITTSWGPVVGSRRRPAEEGRLIQNNGDIGTQVEPTRLQYGHVVCVSRAIVVAGLLVQPQRAEVTPHRGNHGTFAVSLHPRQRDGREQPEYDDRHQ